MIKIMDDLWNIMITIEQLDILLEEILIQLMEIENEINLQNNKKNECCIL